MATFVAVLALIWTTVAAAAPPRPFASRVGVNVKFGQGQSMSDLPMLRELGVTWVRDSVLWADIERKPGEYLPFPRDFATRLAFYKGSNIGVCFPVLYDNPKAYPKTAADPLNPWNAAAYGRFAAEMAKRLRASGVRFVMEIYNEPHNSMKDLGGPFNGEPPCPWLDQYVTMCHAATDAIKAVDPQIKVISDEDMWVLHYRFLEKGMPRALDGMAVHPYVRSWPELSATEPDTSWTKPFVTVDADRSIASAVRRLRDAGAEKLEKTPSVWITEWGWPLGEPLADGRVMNEDLLAGLIPRAYVTAADAGVEALLWFSLQDSVDGPMGLTTNERVRRVPFKAFSTMTRALGKTTTIAHVEGSTHRTGGLQAYRLGGAGVPSVWVIWNIDGDTATDVAVGDATPKATDVLGNAVAWPAAKDGVARVTFGRSPLYVTGLADDTAFRPVTPKGQPPAYLFP